MSFQEEIQHDKGQILLPLYPGLVVNYGIFNTIVLGDIVYH